MNIFEQILSILGILCFISIFLLFMCICYKLINLLDQLTNKEKQND